MALGWLCVCGRSCVVVLAGARPSRALYRLLTRPAPKKPPPPLSSPRPHTQQQQPRPRFVPAPYRILYNNVVAIAWITLLSLLTHSAHGGAPLLVFLLGAAGGGK